MITKRLKISIVMGAILGVVCIVGAMIRSGFEKDAIYLFAFWYNRVIIGLVIGLAGGNLAIGKAVGRGALLGFLVSFAFYSATGYSDPIGFSAGIVYGMIIEFTAAKYGNSVKPTAI